MWITAIASRNSPETLDEISTIFFPPLTFLAAGNEKESPVNFQSGSQRAIYKHQEYNVTDKQ